MKIELTEHEIDLIDSAFETFENKSTEFILAVAQEEVAESLDIDEDIAIDLIMDYLYKNKE